MPLGGGGGKAVRPTAACGISVRCALRDFGPLRTAGGMRGRSPQRGEFRSAQRADLLPFEISYPDIPKAHRMLVIL